MSSGFIPLHTSAPLFRPEWELEDDVTVPESEMHDTILSLLKLILQTWAARTENGAHVMRDRAFRWVKENPRIGVDPDISVVAAEPPEGIRLRSVRTWQDGHAPPFLAIEVVSVSHPWKDYVTAPEKYAAAGAEELWVFDPLLEGPKTTGGPFVLQVWRRSDDGGFARVYEGTGPARSARLEAWIVPMPDGMLRIADDAEGANLWPTEAEAERAAKETALAAKETALAAKEAERAAKETALARIAELEAELARRKTDPGSRP